MRLLYLQTSLVPPTLDRDADRFFLLAGSLEGEVLQPVWYRDSEQVEKVFGPGSWPIFKRGSFQYRWFLAWRWEGVRRALSASIGSISPKGCARIGKSRSTAS